MAKVAFLGLGVMGFPMAGYLAKNGHDVSVYNRTRAKADAWVAKHGGKAADTPKAAAQGAAIVFSCVGDDPDLRAVTLGADGAFEGMAAGGIYVDHTTASANIARELFAAAARKGIHFIDAPVSGGQAGAENGTLTVMCGGEAAPSPAWPRAASSSTIPPPRPMSRANCSPRRRKKASISSTRRFRAARRGPRTARSR